MRLHPHLRFSPNRWRSQRPSLPRCPAPHWSTRLPPRIVLHLPGTYSNGITLPPLRWMCPPLQDFREATSPTQSFSVNMRKSSSTVLRGNTNAPLECDAKCKIALFKQSSAPAVWVAILEDNTLAVTAISGQRWAMKLMMAIPCWPVPQPEGLPIMTCPPHLS